MNIIQTMTTGVVEADRTFFDQMSIDGTASRPIPLIAKIGIVSKSSEPLPRHAASANAWKVAIVL